MKAKIDLGSEQILPVVCSLAIPTMLAQFVNVLYSIVDRMYIGNIEGIGSLALAGVGICGPVLTLISSFASLVGLGGSPLIAMFLGRGQRDRAEDVVSNGFAVLIALAAFLTAACLLARTACSCCSEPARLRSNTPTPTSQFTFPVRSFRFSLRDLTVT